MGRLVSFCSFLVISKKLKQRERGIIHFIGIRNTYFTACSLFRDTRSKSRMTGPDREDQEALQSSFGDTKLSVPVTLDLGVGRSVACGAALRTAPKGFRV